MQNTTEETEFDFSSVDPAALTFALFVASMGLYAAIKLLLNFFG